MKYFLLALAAGAAGYYVGARRAALPPADDVKRDEGVGGTLWDRIGAAFSNTLGAATAVGASAAPAASGKCEGCGGHP